jgi:putative methionine-R-sulfoxide reductase with GAF domain
MPGPETRHRIEQLRQALGQALLAGDTREQRLQQVAAALADFFGVERCILGLVEGDTARAVAGVGLGIAGHPQHAVLPLGRGIVGRALRTGETQLVDDVLHDPDYYAAAALTRSELVAPVLRGGAPALMLNLESNRLAAFTHDDAAVLEAVAAWLATRLDRLLP